MSIFPLPSTATFLSFATCRRCISRSPPVLRFAATSAVHRVPQLSTPAFSGLGLSLGVIKGLQAAFPAIKDATEAQREFIPAIMSGKNLLLKGPTGSGKSFGLVLALLSKHRPPKREVRPAASSLLIVPHRDLAFQFLHWVERIVRAADPSQSVESYAQALVRSASMPVSLQADQLRKNPPSLLIATPQALLDLLTEYPKALDLKNLSTVAVDEVDYLVDYIPSESMKYTKQKIMLRMERHPTPTKQLLDHIYAPRIVQAKSSARPNAKLANADSLPQLVLCSATFRIGLRRQIFANKWLGSGQGELIKVQGAAIQNEQEQEEQEAVIGGKNVQHCALVVSETGDIRNIEGAVEVDSPLSQEVAEQEPAAMTVPSTTSALPVDLPELPDEMLERFSMTASPFHPPVMEAIAAAFAVDVPGVAMLVLPASAPVQRAVYDLRMLGVNAVGLDLLSDARGRNHLLRGSGAEAEENPTLLVTTLATTRGLDLPDLSHVFILGVCSARKVDSYLHLAGRVGRFGRGGKVVSVLEERREVENGEKSVWKDEPRQYRLMLKTLGLNASRHEYFY